MHFEQLKEAVKTAATTNGFAFIEAVSPCPTAFGRRIGLKDAAETLRWFKENSLTLEKANKMTKKELANKFVVGEFVRRKRPTFREHLHEALKEAEKTAKEN